MADINETEKHINKAKVQREAAEQNQQVEFAGLAVALLGASTAQRQKILKEKDPKEVAEMGRAVRDISGAGLPLPEQLMSRVRENPVLSWANFGLDVVSKARTAYWAGHQVRSTAMSILNFFRT